jgi:hypothetical protein
MFVFLWPFRIKPHRSHFTIFAKDRTMRTYSRDEQSGPAERLAAMIGAISSGRFDPDAPRGSRWKAVEQAVEDPGSDVSDSSESSGAETESEQEETLLEVSEYLTGTKIMVDGRYFQHSSSCKVHRGKAGYLSHLACGEYISGWYTRLASGVSNSDDRTVDFCDKCFRSQKPEVSNRLKRLYSELQEPEACDLFGVAEDDGSQVASQQ